METITGHNDAHVSKEKYGQMVHDIDTNFIYLSPWLRDLKEYSEFFLRLRELLDRLNIPWAFLPKTEDVWARDFMPIQMGEDSFVCFRYEPDYLMCLTPNERYMTNPDKVCKALGIAYQKTDINMDGGNFVFCGDCIVMTDKVFRENEDIEPNLLKERLEEVFGYPIVFIPWTPHANPDDKEADVYGHADGFIKWCGGKMILMTNHRETQSCEADYIRKVLEEHGFEVTELSFDVSQPDETVNWAYINFLQVGNHIIMPTFDIEEDKQAQEQIARLFPECDIHPIEMRSVANDGGAMHCISWNIIKTGEISIANKDVISRLQNEAADFLRNHYLSMNGVKISPKEVEVYYYKDKEFEDDSVHRNELQSNNQFHLYVHRTGKTKESRYKGGNYPGVDLVLSDNASCYYTLLLRSVSINGGDVVVGPHKVLEVIMHAVGLESYASLEDQPLAVQTERLDCNILCSERINLGKTVRDVFRQAPLRLVLEDKDYQKTKYRFKERMIKENLPSRNTSTSQYHNITTS